MSVPEKTVAIVGASADRTKFGNKSVRAHLKAGFRVFPINPRGGEIEGLATYTSMSELPADSVQRCSMYVPPSVGLALLPEIAVKTGELWLNSGSASAELIAAARALELEVIEACSIVALGLSPAEFP